jgi:hypothetical protein
MKKWKKKKGVKLCHKGCEVLFCLVCTFPEMKENKTKCLAGGSGNGPSSTHGFGGTLSHRSTLHARALALVGSQEGDDEVLPNGPMQQEDKFSNIPFKLTFPTRGFFVVFLVRECTMQTHVFYSVVWSTRPIGPLRSTCLLGASAGAGQVCRTERYHHEREHVLPCECAKFGPPFQFNARRR